MSELKKGDRVTVRITPQVRKRILAMSKKTQIAKLIMEMTANERLEMADDFVDMQSNAADDGSGFDLEGNFSVSRMLLAWARGLGSME